MATPAFLLWSSFASSSSSSQEDRNDGGTAQNGLPTPPDPAAKDSSPARPKPKPKKASKAAAPKRPPQRGLGVAQLERLLHQERWKKITEIDPSREVHPFPGQLPVYDYPPAVSPLGAYGAPAPPPAPAAVAAYGSGWVQAPGMCYIQQCRPASPGLAGYDGAIASTVRSVLHEQYSLDRYRMGKASGEGRFQVGSPFPEPPSNQKMQCFSDQCEFCARKKRLFGDNPGFSGNNGVDYFEMDLAAAMAVDQESQGLYGCGPRRGKAMMESREAIKEFDFFPQSRSASLGHSEFGNRGAGDASSSSSSSAAASPSFVDLSLKLSV
ncbi:translation initiation factor IF-2-like [Cocos nucifera]|uniref:Translation initiation factor IF-2-like n=1 Tax=Cocos nucifera TaxID=13894 RepID=A0A8K0ICA0_COCNU|nr:translation initiation factor IF-2-like [Cocos nucifera]